MPQIRALRFHGKEDIRVEDVPRQQLGANDIRIHLAYCGICGTDIHEYLAGPIFPPKAGSSNPHTGLTLPVTLGHEFSGTVTEVGSSVASVRTGQHVAINPSVDDRHLDLPPCRMCQIGKPNVCKHWCCHGLSAEGGGCAEEIVVKAIAAVPIPEGVSLQEGALAEPLAVANHMIKLAGIERDGGNSALILGAGPIGLALLLLLKAKGIRWVGSSELAEKRKEKAKEFGADAVFSPAEVNVVEEVLKATDGEGVDVAFDATGIQATLDTAIAATRAGGTIFNVAIHEKALSINPNDIFFTEKRYMGGMCYVTADFEEVLSLMKEGKLKAKDMITKVVQLEDSVDGAFLELVKNKDDHVKILVTPQK